MQPVLNNTSSLKITLLNIAFQENSNRNLYKSTRFLFFLHILLYITPCLTIFVPNKSIKQI